MANKWGRMKNFLEFSGVIMNIYGIFKDESEFLHIPDSILLWNLMKGLVG